MRIEINLADHYRGDLSNCYAFSRYNKNRPFKAMTREDIISFLEAFRKSEASDVMHKWIGTYNIYIECIWLGSLNGYIIQIGTEETT